MWKELLFEEMEVQIAMLENRTKHSKRFAEVGDLNEMICTIRVRHSGI